MNKIRTYDDLLKEESRLQLQLADQEKLIRQDLVALGKDLEPARKAFNTVKRIFTRDNRVPLFNIGLELGLDLLLRKIILSRAGWFTRILVPYLVKNYSSHIIAEEKRKAFVQKIRQMFARIRPKQARETASQGS